MPSRAAIIPCHTLMRGLTNYVRKHDLHTTGSLTERELEILSLISEGIGGSGISQRLFISTSTVKREIRHIFDKLGVNDRSHAVALGIRRGLVKSPSDLA